MRDDIRTEPSKISSWYKTFEYSALKLKMNSQKIDISADLNSPPELMSEATKPGGSWPENRTESSKETDHTVCHVSLRATSLWQIISCTYWTGG